MIIGLHGIGSLGDCLFLTPVIQALAEKGEKTTVQMHTETQSREVSVIFEGLADVEFTDTPVPRLYILNKDKVHSAKRALHQLGFYNHSCIPKIKLEETELNWATSYLSKFINPIILVNDGGGTSDPTNYRAKYVKGPPDNMQKMADFCILKGYTVLQFGHKREILGSGYKSFTPLDGAIHIRNLDIRQQAACFSIIRRIIAFDSGLQHLMLSVGGQAVVSIPDESLRLGYEYWDLLYPESEFEGEVRVKYINHRNFLNNKEDILSYLNS